MSGPSGMIALVAAKFERRTNAKKFHHVAQNDEVEKLEARKRKVIALVIRQRPDRISMHRLLLICRRLMKSRGFPAFKIGQKFKTLKNSRSQTG